MGYLNILMAFRKSIALHIKDVIQQNQNEKEPEGSQSKDICNSLCR